MSRELEHHIEIETLAGPTYTWGPDEPEVANVFTDLSFSTKRMDGFASASCRLRRRIDLDWPDVGLFDLVTIRNGVGDIVWEGRVSAVPRQLDDSGHVFQIEMTGLMAHARDRKFTQIYVDRDLGNWGEPRYERKKYLSDTARTTKFSIQGSTAINPAPDGDQALELKLDRINSSGTIRQTAEALYDAQDIDTIASVWYQVLHRDADGNALNTGDWLVALSSSTVADAATFTTTGSLSSGSTGFFAPTANARFIFNQLYPLANVTADGSWNAWWELAVYGSSGIELSGETLPLGVTASNVMRHIISAYCPLLNSSGVEDTDHVIGQLAFRERTDPYDAFLELNRYHRWELGAFENRTVKFWPADYTKADWTVRTDEGWNLDLQGDTTEGLANGCTVQFQDVKTGVQRTITPDDDAGLADVSETNPANMAGYPRWEDFTVSVPCTYEDAIKIGQAMLAEFNQAKQPGRLSGGAYAYDRHGNRQPTSLMRASQTVQIEDFADARPRLITETDFSDESKTVGLAVEGGVLRVEAFMDRYNNALQAANLTFPG